MINLLTEVAAMIEEADLGTVGEDLFVGTLPADVTRGAMLRSPLTGADVDEGMLDFYDTEFQVIVRDPDVQAGYDRALTISKMLRANNIQRGNIFITWMRRDTLPVSYPRGDADDIETAVKIRVGYGETA